MTEELLLDDLVQSIIDSLWYTFAFVKYMYNFTGRCRFIPPITYVKYS